MYKLVNTASQGIVVVKGGSMRVRLLSFTVLLLTVLFPLPVAYPQERAKVYVAVFGFAEFSNPEKRLVEGLADLIGENLHTEARDVVVEYVDQFLTDQLTSRLQHHQA